MIIQYASDLHLEFGENSVWLRQNPLVPIGDVLVLSGDIGYIGDTKFLKHPFWDWASDHFKEVIVIPGNHEFYRIFDIDQLCEGWTLHIKNNVRYLYNSVFRLDQDTDLIVSTLWSDISPLNGFIVERSVNDFHHIRSGKYRLTWERFNEEHQRCKHFIEDAVLNSSAKHLIVASHHLPSYALMREEYRNNPISEAFATELGHWIAHSRINYWVYGHSHHNICKKIGNTECVCNQLGYIRSMEQLSFRRDAVIEV